MTSLPPDATPKTLDSYIEAVCEAAPGEGSKGCLACKGCGVLMHDGVDIVPAPGWTGDVLTHYQGVVVVVDVGQASECPQCIPAKERPRRPSPEHVWLMDGWVLL